MKFAEIRQLEEMDVRVREILPEKAKADPRHGLDAHAVLNQVIYCDTPRPPATEEELLAYPEVVHPIVRLWWDGTPVRDIALETKHSAAYVRDVLRLIGYKPER